MNIPVQPDWMFHRPFLTMDFVRDNDPPDLDPLQIGTLPHQLQENAIIEDLLSCMEVKTPIFSNDFYFISIFLKPHFIST